MMWGFGWGFMFFAPICMILFGLAIYFIFASSRGRMHGHCGHHDYYPIHGKALDILNERYAKGEITQEQYSQMRKTLEGN